MLPYIWLLKYPDIRFFFTIAALSELLVLILFFFRKQKKSKELKFAFICQLTSIISDITASLLRRINSIYFSMSVDIFTIVALIVLSYLFHSIINGNKSRKFILFPSIAVIIYFIFKILAGNKSGSFNSMNVAILAILVIVWSILFFYEQLTKPADSDQLFLYSSPAFWIVVAYLIYFAGTFFLFIYSQNKNIERGTQVSIQYSLINGVFVLIKNILLSIAMFTKTDNNKLPSKYRSQTY